MVERLLTKVLKVAKWLMNRFIYVFQSLEFASFQTRVKLRKFIFLRKTIINKSLGFIAFAHYPNIVLSFFKNNPNTSLPKLHTDLSSEIKELF